MSWNGIKIGVMIAAVGVLASSARGADWDYTLAPYLWGTGIEGTQGVGGITGEVDAGFSDILEVLDIGYAARFEARNPSWGLFADYFYAKLSDDQNLPQGTLSGEVKQTIAEGGVSYRIHDDWEALVGVRYQKSELGLKLGIGAMDNSKDWIDYFVGARWTFVDQDSWFGWLKGDIGAGDSDLVWLASVAGGYRFNPNFSLILAYKYLDTDYQDNDFTWDIVQSGLGLGLGIHW